jgi:hypothetical protein
VGAPTLGMCENLRGCGCVLAAAGHSPALGQRCVAAARKFWEREDARFSSVTAWSWTWGVSGIRPPLQGLKLFWARFPGRCPGLLWSCPFGANAEPTRGRRGGGAGTYLGAGGFVGSADVGGGWRFVARLSGCRLLLGRVTGGVASLNLRLQLVTPDRGLGSFGGT